MVNIIIIITLYSKYFDCNYIIVIIMLTTKSPPNSHPISLLVAADEWWLLMELILSEIHRLDILLIDFLTLSVHTVPFNSIILFTQIRNNRTEPNSGGCLFVIFHRTWTTIPELAYDPSIVMPLADWLTHPPTHSLASIPMMWDQRNPSLLLSPPFVVNTRPLICDVTSIRCQFVKLVSSSPKLWSTLTMWSASHHCQDHHHDHHPPRDIFFGPKLLLYYSFVLRVSVRHHRQAAADYTRHNTPQPQKQQRQHCCWWCSGGPCRFVPSRFSICIANFFFWARTTVKLLKLDFPPIDY